MANINDLCPKRDDEKLIQEFVDRKEIGKKVLEDFVTFYQEEKGGYYLSEYTPKFGLIANLMAIDTFITIDDFGTQLNENNLILLKLFKSVYEKIVVNGNYVFDASPYIENDNHVFIDSFVETASKAATVMSDLRTYIIKTDIDIPKGYKLNNDEINNKNELLFRIDDILISAVKMLNSSCLRNSNPIDYKINEHVIKRGNLSPQITYRGWTFEKVKNQEDEYGISLYFTYHATSAFLYIYQAFAELFDEKYEGKEISNSLTTNDKERIKNDREFFEKNIKYLDEFRTKVISTGRYLETLMAKNEINIANDYINKDIMPISDTNIISTERSNDVLNTLFAIGILTNAGLDDDYNSIGQITTFQEQIQFGINNIKKMYLLLKKDKKEDNIETYHLLFNERCPKDRIEDTQEYRKRCDEAETYDFIPLFSSVYNTVFQYLIKFPQKEMHDILELIMENSKEGKWYWTTYGFEINNNLYYLFGVKSFYDYYLTYELPLSENGKKYNEIANEAIQELEQKNKMLEEEIARRNDWERKYNEKQSDLDKEVYTIAEKACSDIMSRAIEKYLNEMVDECKQVALNVVKEKNLNSTASIKPSMLNQDYPKAKLLLRMLSSLDFKKIVLEDLGESINRSDQSSVDEIFNKKIINRILIKLEN